MNVDSIRDGIVIDHIAAGCGMKLYRLLGLENLEAPVAMITNVVSGKLGRKDIIKIDAAIDVDLDIIGYVDPGATVNIIRGGERHEAVPVAGPGGAGCSGGHDHQRGLRQAGTEGHHQD